MSTQDDPPNVIYLRPTVDPLANPPRNTHARLQQLAQEYCDTTVALVLVRYSSAQGRIHGIELYFQSGHPLRPPGGTLLARTVETFSELLVDVIGVLKPDQRTFGSFEWDLQANTLGHVHSHRKELTPCD